MALQNITLIKLFMSGPAVKILKDFVSLIYPPLCIVCKSVLMNQEDHICTSCHYNLPRTNFHLYPENSLAEEFWGRVYIENAAALYYFEKGGKGQKILHEIKYRKNRKLAFYLGEVYGKELLDNGKFTDADIIVPVPLHHARQKKRGFNQSEWFARGLSSIMAKPLSADNLTRILDTESQTKKSRIDRWDNVRSSFRVLFPGKFENRHIILVDDVVTTGATLDACATLLKGINGTKVSILALAFA
jgi:ComF family protein